jgi:hypothetical protein
MRCALSLDAVVVAVSEQVSCDLDGEAIVLDLRGGSYFGLDPIGARIWRMLETPHSLASIRDALVREYDVQPEVCARFLLPYISDLARHSLVEVRRAPAP